MPKPSVSQLSTVGRAIRQIRHHNVILDADLAALYGVSTRALNQAVKRNRARFPPDFMFVLTTREFRALRSQTVTLERGRGAHRKYRPYAFTEQGVAMLSGLLRSHRAVAVNIGIMRAFVQMRQTLASMPELTKRLDELETKYDGQFRVVFGAIRALMQPPGRPKRAIGFGVRRDG